MALAADSPSTARTSRIFSMSWRLETASRGMPRLPPRRFSSSTSLCSFCSSATIIPSSGVSNKAARSSSCFCAIFSAASSFILMDGSRFGFSAGFAVSPRFSPSGASVAFGGVVGPSLLCGVSVVAFEFRRTIYFHPIQSTVPMCFGTLPRLSRRVNEGNLISFMRFRDDGCTDEEEASCKLSPVFE